MEIYSPFPSLSFFFLSLNLRRGRHCMICHFTHGNKVSVSSKNDSDSLVHDKSFHLQFSDSVPLALASVANLNRIPKLSCLSFPLSAISMSYDIITDRHTQWHRRRFLRPPHATYPHVACCSCQTQDSWPGLPLLCGVASRAADNRWWVLGGPSSLERLNIFPAGVGLKLYDLDHILFGRDLQLLGSHLLVRVYYSLLSKNPCPGTPAASGSTTGTNSLHSLIYLFRHYLQRVDSAQAWN